MVAVNRGYVSVWQSLLASWHVGEGERREHQRKGMIACVIYLAGFPFCLSSSPNTTYPHPSYAPQHPRPGALCGL